MRDGLSSMFKDLEAALENDGKLASRPQNPII